MVWFEKDEEQVPTLQHHDISILFCRLPTVNGSLQTVRKYRTSHYVRAALSLIL